MFLYIYISSQIYLQWFLLYRVPCWWITLSSSLSLFFSVMPLNSSICRICSMSFFFLKSDCNYGIVTGPGRGWQRDRCGDPSHPAIAEAEAAAGVFRLFLPVWSGPRWAAIQCAQSHRLSWELDSARQAALRAFGFAFSRRTIKLGATGVRASGHVLRVRGERAGKSKGTTTSSELSYIALL